MKSQKIYLIIGLSAMLALSAASFAQTNNAAAGAATSDQTQQDQAQQTADRVWDHVWHCPGRRATGWSDPKVLRLLAIRRRA
jgi:hypothetical protein